MLHTPVLFLIFNRPDTTAQVFEAIRQAQPKNLFVAADGPRENRPEDIERCRLAREIATQVDWICEVKFLFREKNLGCKYAVSSAIDWFFDNVEEGIILEDDTLPNQSFFSFCEKLLDYYRTDDRIMHIGAVNFQLGRKRGRSTYYFSCYSHVWGWATWRRAWRLYKLDVNDFNEPQLTNNIKSIFKPKIHQQCWIDAYQKLKQNDMNTWDYQWNFSIWANAGLSIIPNYNLVSNIGFGTDATHTYQNESLFSNMEIVNLSNLIHPSNISPNQNADYYTYKILINPPATFLNKVRNFAYRHLSNDLIFKIKNLRPL
jgi:hypothetical protein